MTNQRKKYPITKQNRIPQQNHQNKPELFFQGNLVQNMQFGGKDHELSGYVQRTLIMKDRYGNIQIAKEKQFFNSCKKLGHIKINDD